MKDLCSWDRTKIMYLRLEDRIKDGKYEGRHVIHRDTPINGGVYLGSAPREAIVIDSKRYPALGKLYAKAKEKATVCGYFRKDLVLNAVYSAVKEAMPNSSEKAIESIRTALNAGKDDKIALDIFIDNKVGNCTHKALACAVLLEMFRDEKLISGKASVDRNTVKFSGAGHAWCRYTNSCGQVYILDVAKGFIGSLEDSMKEGPWLYARPEDNLGGQ